LLAQTQPFIFFQILFFSIFVISTELWIDFSACSKYIGFMIAVYLFAFIYYLRPGGASPPCACLRQRPS
jgi:hypothetical protein